MCHGQMIPLQSFADFERRCDICENPIRRGEQLTSLSFKRNGEKVTIYVCTRCSATDAWKKHVPGSRESSQGTAGCG